MFLVKSSAKYSFYGVGKWQGAKDIIHHEGTITFSFERHVGNIHKGRPCTTKLRYSQKKVKNANIWVQIATQSKTGRGFGFSSKNLIIYLHMCWISLIIST